jgi:hypothetical protein
MNPLFRLRKFVEQTNKTRKVKPIEWSRSFMKTKTLIIIFFEHRKYYSLKISCFFSLIRGFSFCSRAPTRLLCAQYNRECSCGIALCDHSVFIAFVCNTQWAFGSTLLVIHYTNISKHCIWLENIIVMKISDCSLERGPKPVQNGHSMKSTRTNGNIK